MLALVDTIEEDRVYNNNYKSIKKIGNKIVKISTKTKSLNLSMFWFKNLSKSKNV